MSPHNIRSFTTNPIKLTRRVCLELAVCKSELAHFKSKRDQLGGAILKMKKTTILPVDFRVCPRDSSRIALHAAPQEYFQFQDMLSRYTKTCHWCQSTYALERAKKRLKLIEDPLSNKTRTPEGKRKPPKRDPRSLVLRRIAAHVTDLEGRSWDQSNQSILNYCGLFSRTKAEEFLAGLKQDWTQAGADVVLDRRVPGHVFDRDSPRHRRAQMHYTNLRILPAAGTINIGKTSIEQSATRRDNCRFQDVIGWSYGRSFWLGIQTGWLLEK
jgi:hypothetical protein